MGAQPSKQNSSTYCEEMFKCWYSPSSTSSPYKESTQEPFLYEIDVKDLLQSNKDRQKQNGPLVMTSQFLQQFDLNFLPENSNTFKKNNTYDNDLPLQMLTCKKQLFVKGKRLRGTESIETNEETIRGIFKQSIKENQNQNIANFAIKSKILFEGKQSNLNYEYSQSPANKQSRLLSIQSDFLTLKENSFRHKTPISQNWRHFLSSINRTKFLRSNQGEQKHQTISNQKSNKLINYLNANYIGSAEGSIPNGYGQIRYHNGDMLFGYFQNNLCQGKGKYIKKDGSLYEGQFLHGEASGFGVYLGSDGYRYEGQWRNNQPNGKGKAVYSDFTTYEGQFVDGKKHGNGNFFQNGCRFSGQFKNDQVDGTALFISDNGQTYNGEWKMNVKEGFGEYKWPNGDRYVGNYKDGKRQGYGVMYYENGDTFSGNWKNGMKNGQGIYSSNNTTISGSWVRSKFVESSTNQ